MEPASATLIFAVVAKEFADPIVRVATRLGATGATHWRARGTGSDAFTMFDAIFHMEPDREVIGIVVPAELVEPVLEAVLAIVPVDTPGNGFVASFALDQVAGIANVIATAQATSR